MFSDEFSMVIGAICLILAIVFFLGKGAGIISAFDGKNAPARKKKSPEDERKYQKGFGIFCLVLAIGELLNIVLPLDETIVGILCIAIVVVDVVFIVIYLRKYFPEG